MKTVEIEKIGSSLHKTGIKRVVNITDKIESPKVGDVIAVRALSESTSYGNIELCSGRLAKINAGDVLAGVIGKRRALKGFVGDVPEILKSGDRLHLLNMGGVMGVCHGHHSSFSDAIELEFLGGIVNEDQKLFNLSSFSLKPAQSLQCRIPIIIVAGTCMNSGKTVAATELIKRATSRGFRAAGAKLTGIACLRDTLHMQDNGAIATASFLDAGLPSTVDAGDLAPVAKSIINKLTDSQPDIIIAELGDGIVGGYSVDTILKDAEFREAISCFVFCASDYVGVVGGRSILSEMGIDIDVVAGSVTDSKMGEDYITANYGLTAGNARRDGERLFSLVSNLITGANSAA